MFQRLSRKGRIVPCPQTYLQLFLSYSFFPNRDALTTGSLSAITSISVSWIILFMTLLLCQPCLNYLSHGIFLSIGQYTSSCPPGTRGILAI